MPIRTNSRHNTITEVHPYHGTADHLGGVTVDIQIDRDGEGNDTVFEQYDERCPLCRVGRRSINGIHEQALLRRQ